jgi:hypothetical protein
MESEQTPKAPIARNQLTRLQAHRLYSLLETHYVEKRVDDPAFAAYASDALGFPVTVANVANAREELKIPSLDELEDLDRSNALRLAQQLDERVSRLEEESARSHGKYLGINDRLAQLNARLENIESRNAEESAGGN